MSLSQPYALASRPEDPASWADYLALRLTAQSAQAQRMNDYYEGRHSLLYAQDKFRNAFGKLISHFADNFCSLIVDSVAERLQVEGFRMTEDPAADADAWRIWQRNNMDSWSSTAMVESLVAARSFATVWGDPDGQPVIQLEDANEMAVWYDLSLLDRRTPQVALKRWMDEWGTWHARLWTPTASYKMTGTRNIGTWGDYEVTANPLGVVPVVELANRPRLRFDPTSELALVAPIQDAINKVVRDALVASEYAAFPQRWVTGLEIEIDEQGQPKKPPFDSALDRLFQAEDKDVSFGQFQAADLGNYAKLVEVLVQHLATISRVPFHYFLLNGGQAPSGEAIASAEAGLVAKVRDRQLHFGDSWESVMRLAFRVLDDERAYASTAETIWRDPEYRTEGQHIDALLKLRTLGLPLQQLWEDAGYSPSQIDRFGALRRDEVMLAAEADAAAFMPTDSSSSPTDATDAADAAEAADAGDGMDSGDALDAIAISEDSPYTPTPLQVGMYHALESVVEKAGKFDQTTGNNGAHYVDPSPFAAEGMACANCYFFEGPRGCEIVDGDIAPGAVCKLWVIPEELLTRGDAQP